MGFDKLGLDTKLVALLKKLAITEPTPIQELVISRMLSRENILATSQTGSGKTLAYLLPLVQLLSHEKSYGRVRMIVLLPTRELVNQVGKVCAKLCDVTQLRCSVVYGGVAYKPQIDSLSAFPEIVIATPGRLIDLLRQNVVCLKYFDYFILDEVDKMLDLGFREPIMYLAELRSFSAQTCCFSATLPEIVVEMVKKLAVNVEVVNIDNQKLAVEQIEQLGYYVEKKMIDNLLIYLLRQEKPQHAIVFTRSRSMADRLTSVLQENTISAEAMHSDRSQLAREHILSRFKDGETSIIVATDVIARGIDIDNVTHVFNFGLPQDPEQYIHRIGRTGRAGRIGKAITLCEPSERQLLEAICKLMKQNIPMGINHPYMTSEVTLALSPVYASKQNKSKNKKKRK